MYIPFEREWRDRYHALLEEVFDSGVWSGGNMQRRFETEFGDYVGLSARAVSNGGAALLAIFEYLDVRGRQVIVPANTFWATSLAARRAGAEVVYADCNREDLCLSVEDLQRKVTRKTKVVCVVHIGGHIAFQIDDIAALCGEHDILLVEDCAHVHGGSWKGKCGGHFGFAGAYSFYATKTMPTGEGGMVVSRDGNFLDWLDMHRNYGKRIVEKKVTYPVSDGFNARMSELTAALGVLQLERLPEILKWKRALANKYDRLFERRVRFPDGMESGYYKYIVFDCQDLKETSGLVFGPGDLGPGIDGSSVVVPNSEWISTHHQCPPMWYGWQHGGDDVERLRGVLL